MAKLDSSYPFRCVYVKGLATFLFTASAPSPLNYATYDRSFTAETAAARHVIVTVTSITDTPVPARLLHGFYLCVVCLHIWVQSQLPGPLWPTPCSQLEPLMCRHTGFSAWSFSSCKHHFISLRSAV